MSYFICVETGVILTEQLWIDSNYGFATLSEVEKVNGKWQPKKRA